MAKVKHCCVCKRPLESEDAAILTMGAYGSPKCLCKSCEEKIDVATTSHEYGEIVSACEALGEALTGGDTGDISVIETVNGIIRSAKERAEEINAGTYDFALDEKADENEFDITEDLEETEEDKAKDEKDARISKIVDTVIAYLSAAVIIGVVAYTVIKFIF